MENINRTGIWIDFDKAFIIELNKKGEQLKKVDSNIEHFNVHGGARSKTANGPQDVISESKLLARNQQQQKNFFKTIINQIDSKSDLVVFGPAEAKTNFKKEILEDHSFKNKNIPVESSDNMTENQLIAWVKKYKF